MIEIPDPTIGELQPTVTVSKCLCGHPSCDQYLLSTSKGVGFSLEDATLYAAAPELLDALDWLVGALEAGTLRTSGDLIGKARAAIAKATDPLT